MLNYIPGFQKFPDIALSINPIKGRELSSGQETEEKFCVFHSEEDVTGEVHLRVQGETEFEHIGLNIELIGRIDQLDVSSVEFLNLSKELEPPGIFRTSCKYNFNFKKVTFPYESYHGVNANIKYLVRVTLTKKIFATKSVVEKPFVVHKPSLREPELNANIKLDIGVTNKIQLGCEIFKNKFNLNDCIIGKVNFSSVHMKVKTIEVHLVKRETVGHGTNSKVENILINKFEIVDGSPGEGESAPLRLFLDCFDLSPTYRNINNMLSVNYFLKFAMIDNEDVSYCKQQEIYLWRKQN